MAGTEVWRSFSADPRLPSSAELRATDADRDAAASALREAYADGRLTRHEYDERSSVSLGVRTMGAFLPLLTDLVPAGALPSPQRSVIADIHGKAVQRYQRDLRDARNGWLFVSLTTLGIWAATSVAGGLYFFWPVFPMLGVGVGYFSMRMNRESRIESYENKLAETRRIQRELE